MNWETSLRERELTQLKGLRRRQRFDWWHEQSRRRTKREASRPSLTTLLIDFAPVAAHEIFTSAEHVKTAYIKFRMELHI